MKFRVVVHGRKYCLQTIKKRWFREQMATGVVGLYATRFIEADNANAAISCALEIVTAELAHDGRETGDSTLEVEAIHEDEAGYDLYAPGEGYTFYSEQEPN